MKTIDADTLKDEIRHDLMGYSCMITPDAAIRAVDCIIDRQPAIKPTITLDNLLDLIDYNRESETEKIQICRPDSDWDDCDEVGTSSALLCPFGNAEVKCIGAVDENVIRVDIDWTGLFTLNKEDHHEP